MSDGLLVLSNGHGEDAIAARVLLALHQRRPRLRVAALALVGDGGAYAALEREGWLSRIGPRLTLPSGGFSNQSATALARDLAAGLPGHTLRQWTRIRRWAHGGGPILAIGDLLPLALAWQSGSPYGFIGTPKSDYTWRSGPGRTPLPDGYHRCKGSEWDPWEWALMAHRRCRLVAVRDRLTARGLRRHGIGALAPGNPMLDGLESASPQVAAAGGERQLLLLPGSRMPEALVNARRLLACLPERPAGETWTVWMPTGSRPGPGELAGLLREAGFSAEPERPRDAAGAEAGWRRGGVRLLLRRGSFATWAGRGEVALATAGTATEQVVGLGIPALSLPGPGPQFTTAFARRQSRLLGGAVIPCRSGDELRQRLLQLLADGPRRRRLGRIGRSRMGAAGGSERIAALVEARLLDGAHG